METFICFEDMKPDNNQPAPFYGTAKTRKFEKSKEITVANLKFRPIIDQTGTFWYNATKVISDYLRPSQKNQFCISYMLKIPNMLSSIQPLQGAKNVSYYAESMSAHVSIKEAITTLCNKSTFKKS